MILHSNQPLPYFTSELSGVGGRIKVCPEDFEVEEIPAYEPCGIGDFVYLWIAKRDMGAEFFTRVIAKTFGIRPEEVGTAGLKDRHAVTRQWVSVPASVEQQVHSLDGDGVKVLRVSRHGNKLRPGHLHGNRFRIRIQDVEPDAGSRLPALISRIKDSGLPNFYGPQRFGRNGETLNLGMRLLNPTSQPERVNRFIRKLALSAVQSAIFNLYLLRRMADGLFHTVLAGDVMAKWPFGGMFTATDVPAEQARFDRREIVHTGPIFGKKMFGAEGEAARREAEVLAAARLSLDSFAGFGKLLQGTRRHNIIYIDDLAGESDGGDVVLSFSLPAGSYATVLLREIMKSESV